MEIEVITGVAISRKNHYRAGLRNGKPFIFKDGLLLNYETSFIRQCSIFKDRNIREPFVLFLAFYSDYEHADIDNVATTILDLLVRVKAIKDDSLCFKMICEKRPAAGHPRVEFSLELYNKQK